jgi:hypothetical protein
MSLVVRLVVVFGILQPGESSNHWSHDFYESETISSEVNKDVCEAFDLLCRISLRSTLSPSKSNFDHF